MQNHSALISTMITGWGITYDASREDLEFYNGGSSAWDSKVWSGRNGKAPTLSLKLATPYVNRVVHGARIYPPEMGVKSADKELQALTNGILNAIDKRSGSADAYITALRNATISGIGWWRVAIDEEYGKSCIKIKAVRDPLSILIDPASEMLDGSDARYGAHMGIMPKSAAEQKNWYGANHNPNPYTGYEIPDDCVADVTWYEVKDDGLHISRYVGDALVGEEIVIPGLKSTLLVPCYGEQNYGGETRRFHGIVDDLKDLIRSMNITASNLEMMVARAPKIPVTAYAESIKGFEEEWGLADTEPMAYVRSHHKAPDGTPLPMPQRLDNSPQTDALRSAADFYMGLFPRVTGISDAMLGEMQGAQEAAKSILARMENGEASTGVYLDHLISSVIHTTRLVIHLLPHVYNGSQPVPVVDEKGDTALLNIDCGQIFTPDAIYMLDTDASSGPQMEMRRRASSEALAGIIAQAGEKGAALLDLWVDTQDLPNKNDVQERIKKIMPPEFFTDPEQEVPQEVQAILQEAEAAVASKDETIMAMEGMLREVQNRLFEMENDSRAMLQKAAMDNSTRLQTSQMDNEARKEIELIKQGSEDARLAAKLTAEQRKLVLSFIEGLVQKADVGGTPAAPAGYDGLAPRVPEYLVDDIAEAKQPAMGGTEPIGEDSADE